MSMCGEIENITRSIEQLKAKLCDLRLTEQERKEASVSLAYELKRLQDLQEA